jgi:YbgC/YbaW family acyl-CoA thioester hydrolase
VLTNTTEIEVGFGDCDPAAIVFYPNYFRWFDAAFGQMLRAAGMSMAESRRFPLVEAGANFVGPAAAGDTVTARTRVTEIGRKTIRVSHEVFLGDTAVAKGWEVRVWISADLADPKKILAEPLPEAIRTMLER